MNFRHGLAAAALLASATLTVACAAPTAGTAAAGSTSASSVAATTSSSTPSSTSSASSSSSSPSSATPTEDSVVSSEPPVTIIVEPALDATTAIWLQNSCTDVETLLAALFAYPTVDETAPVEDYRAAYRDYYASVADTVLGITERMAALDAPNIDGGQDLHDGYLRYLIGLADITGNGSILIDEAPADPAEITSIIERIQYETENLGQGDFGLADFQSAELQELMAEVPACQSLMNS